MAFTSEQKRQWRNKPEVQARQANTNASGTRRTSSAALNTCATIAPARWGVGQQLHPHNQQQLAMAVCSMAALPEMPLGPCPRTSAVLG